jgi:hypothetical protein
MNNTEGSEGHKSSSGGILGLIFFIVIAWWIWGHWIHKPVSWTAIYYPDAGNLSVFQDSNVDSLDDCRDWVDAQAQATGNSGYDYECGTNCRLKVDQFGKFYYCKDTIR